VSSIIAQYIPIEEEHEPGMGKEDKFEERRQQQESNG
jgi:hypothetical protein